MNIVRTSVSQATLIVCEAAPFFVVLGVLVAVKTPVNASFVEVAAPPLAEDGGGAPVVVVDIGPVPG